MMKKIMAYIPWCYMKSCVGDDCVAQKNLIKNINWIFRYTFRHLISLFGMLNPMVQMILMLKRNYQNLITGYSFIPSNILFHEFLVH